ncbi:membrane-associated kinase regulator 5-like [Typha angustifolia]|uniref:membrane-associated kinase regulator 5-like n=1 Tax=Typha angustifolia TaxID=59011 RepID=UPI003C2B2ABC
MEVFALLKSRRARPTTSRANAIGEYEGEDDGPFFDLDFPLPESYVEEAKVVLLSLKKPKQASSPERQKKPTKFLIGSKRTEELPVFSFFSRDNSSRSFKSSKSTSSIRDSPARGESKISKFVLRNYLSKIKPLYEKASRAYAGKLIRFSRGARKVGPADGGETTAANGGALPGRLKVAARRLRKSRSASYAVAGTVRSPPQPFPRRRDDSLLEQHDGIQSAIAHCKSSFNKGSELAFVRCRSEGAAEASVRSSFSPKGGGSCN